jgi:hypothetical protein
MSTELKLTKKVIKVSYEDKDYLVAKPSSKQLNDFVKANDTNLDATIALLEQLGLPADISWNMDTESLNEIVLALMPKAPEKKS